MKKNVAILIFDDVEVLDFAGPFEVFAVTNQLNNYEVFNVFTIAKTERPISAVNGLVLTPQYSFTNHPQIDILIITGGQGTRKLIEDVGLLAWVKEIHHKNELTISICSGARILGKLGLLANKPFCTHKGVYEHMKEIAPSAIAQPEKRFVQSDNRLYTSAGISAGIDLSFHIVEKWLGNELAKNTAEYMEYEWPKKHKEN